MGEKRHIHHHSSLGGLWAIGWLFTIGYLKLGFWRGVLALIVWPYFLGAHYADRPPPHAVPPAIEVPQD